MSFIRGEAKPKIVAKPFELFDSKSKEYRELQSGDHVELQFKPAGEPNISSSYINGLIHSVIVDGINTIGIELRINEKEEDDQSYFSDDQKIFWLSDFNAEFSKIITSLSHQNRSTDIAEHTFPEDSGEVTLKYYIGDIQVPVSIGDKIYLDTVSKDRFSMIVTGFERDANDSNKVPADIVKP